MSKILKFKHPLLFGTNFIVKYEEFKEMRLREIGDVDTWQIMPTLMRINSRETPHRVMLNELAITTAKNLFSVIEITGIQIDAEIEERISHNSISEKGTPDFPESLPDMGGDKNSEEYLIKEELFLKAAKHKILNAFAQGSAVSMNTIHHMVDELDNIDPRHKENYDALMKGNEHAYLTIPEPMFIEMACDSNDDERVGGTNKVEFRDGVPYIVARAINFVTLVHEIIKGLYTYLALNAYDTEEEFYEISRYTESIASEIEDIGCGKMIVGMLRTYLLNEFEKYYIHDCFFEMFIVALAKMEPKEMVTLMDGLMKGTPNKERFEILTRNCYYDLKDFV